MSRTSYRAAAERFREALDILGRYRGPCGLCGGVDARHRQADAITGALAAGDDVWMVAEDYRPGDELGCALVAFFALAADPRLHGVSRRVAQDIDAEVWADLAGTGSELAGL